MLELDASEFQGIEWGSPGVVDREKGTVIGAYNLNWRPFNQPKKDRKVPLYSSLIDNDANVAAGWTLEAGENHQMSSSWHLVQCRQVLSLKVVSARYVELLSELGHITVDFDDPIQCTWVRKMSWNGCIQNWYRQLDSSLSDSNEGLSIESLDRQRRRSNG